MNIYCDNCLPVFSAMTGKHFSNALFLISKKDSKEKIDSMHVVEQDMTLNEICSSPIICDKTTG